MKTFKHILPFLLALLVLAGCEDDVNYTQGTAENPDCYGVYFPKKQATRTDLEFEPGTQTEATYTVKRRNTVDPIVVPVVVKSNVEDIFVVEPIAFDAGEDETTFTISFPKAQMGTTYTCDINIEDPRYASIYGADKVNLSISLVLAKWELVTDEKTGETKGRYRDDILGNFASIDNPNANPNPEIELEIYERSDKKGYYRMKAYTPELMNIFAGGQVNHENRNVWTYVDASDPNKVYYPYQSTGLTLFSDMGEWYIATQITMHFGKIPSEWLRIASTDMLRREMAGNGHTGKYESQVFTTRGRGHGATWLESPLVIPLARWIAPDLSLAEWLGEAIGKLSVKRGKTIVRERPRVAAPGLPCMDCPMPQDMESATRLILELRKVVSESLPKIVFYEEFIENRDWFKSTRIADELGISPRQLHQFLAEEGICKYEKRQWVVFPSCRAWQCDVPYTWENSRGKVYTFGSTKRWTQAGRECIIELWRKRNPEYCPPGA